MPAAQEYESLADTPFFKLQAQIASPYAQTPLEVAVKILERAGAKQGQTLIDLGCGDGTVLEAAAKLGLKAVGYEINPYLYREALEKAQKNPLIQVYNKDFFKVDLSQADIIYGYLTPQTLKQLEQKIMKEAKPEVIVITLQYRFPNLKPAKVIHVGYSNRKYTAYIYKPKQNLKTRQPL